MAYSSSISAPSLLMPAVAGGFTPGSTQTGGNQWWYRSTVDTFTTMLGSSYFTDGYARGMRPLDSIQLIDGVNTKAMWAVVSAVTTSQSGKQGGGGATVVSFSTT